MLGPLFSPPYRSLVLRVRRGYARLSSILRAIRSIEIARMPSFPRSACAWPSPAFDACVREELSGLDPDELPLLGALTPGGRVGPEGLAFRVLAAADEAETVRVKVGVLFTETLIGCVCGDDPTSTQVGYCEIEVRIDKGSAAGEIRLLGD